MSINPLFGDDENVATWVKMRIPVWAAPGKFVAIGIVNDTKPLAGVIYNGFREGDCNMHVAADDPRWCTRRVLSVCFGYPFVQMGNRRVTAICAKKNRHARKFVERLGFKYEGKVRQGFPDDDAIIYGMLREECRWVHE